MKAAVSLDRQFDAFVPWPFVAGQRIHFMHQDLTISLDLKAPWCCHDALRGKSILMPSCRTFSDRSQRNRRAQQVAP